MKAYGNHVKIDDEQNNMLVKYDFGVASIFQQSQGSEDVVLGQIQYVVSHTDTTMCGSLSF